VKKIGLLLLIAAGCSTGTKTSNIAPLKMNDLHICAQYNDYVQEMCPSEDTKSADLPKDYKPMSCITDSIKMILETDQAANTTCVLDSQKSQNKLPSLVIRTGS